MTHSLSAYTVSPLSTHNRQEKDMPSKSVVKNAIPFLNVCNRLKVDSDHHTSNPRNQCTGGYSHSEGLKWKLVKGLVGFRTLQSSSETIRRQKTQQSHVQHSCPYSTPATFHPSAAHLSIHKNGVMSSVLIGWVGGYGRVRGPPDLSCCVCEN